MKIDPPGKAAGTINNCRKGFRNWENDNYCLKERVNSQVISNFILEICSK